MRRIAIVGIIAGAICATPARAQMAPWGMRAQLQLQLQWQRQQIREQRLMQQQLRSRRSLALRSAKSSRKALSSNPLARQQAAEMRRLLQLIHKEQQHRLALLRRITVARQTTLTRIQRASNRAQPTRPLALQRTPIIPPRSTPQLFSAGQSLPRTPLISERTQMASLLNELAPLMFLHGRERPSVPSNVRPHPPPAALVRVSELSATSWARKQLLSRPQAGSSIVHKPAVLAPSPLRTPANLMQSPEAENAVSQLVLRIATGEFNIRRSTRNEPSVVQPDKIKQAPPRPVLVGEHPVMAWPRAEASALAASSRPSLVEVVRRAPPPPSLP
jgi:hypothetical protein